MSLGDLLAFLAIAIVLGAFFAVGMIWQLNFSKGIKLTSGYGGYQNSGFSYQKPAPLPIGYYNSLGLKSNPYFFYNGFQGAGWYEFTTSEFIKLSSIPASGIKMNPTYMSNPLFYKVLGFWINYTHGKSLFVR